METTNNIKRSPLWNRIFSIVSQIPMGATNGDAMDYHSCTTAIEQMLLGETTTINSVIGCAEKLYYDINPDTKMDVPSYFYEKVEAVRPSWFSYIEAGGKMNFYEYCKAEFKV